MKNVIKVFIRKITLGSNGKVYLVLEHPLANNYPSLVIEKIKFEILKKFIKKDL